MPESRADDGQTPMTIALGNGHAAAAEAFLDAGVAIEGDETALARFTHLADEIVGMNVENIKAADLARDGIDIAFADRMFLADSVGQYLMKEYIKPAHIILVHARPEELDSAESGLRPFHPNLIIFMDQMEKKVPCTERESAVGMRPHAGFLEIPARGVREMRKVLSQQGVGGVEFVRADEVVDEDLAEAGDFLEMGSILGILEAEIDQLECAFESPLAVFGVVPRAPAQSPLDFAADVRHPLEEG